MFPVLNMKFTLFFLFLRDDIQTTSRSKSIKVDKISPVQNIFELQMFYEVIQQKLSLIKGKHLFGIHNRHIQ